MQVYSIPEMVERVEAIGTALYAESRDVGCCVLGRNIRVKDIVVRGNEYGSKSNYEVWFSSKESARLQTAECQILSGNKANPLNWLN